MRSDERYTILAVLALVVIGALALFVSGPLLYTLEKDTFPSRFHDNPDVLKVQALNSTTDILPLMQDLLDYTGPIVLNIRIKDIEEARRDLELFAKNHGSFDNLVIKLDMSASELEEFSKSKALQQELLMSLLNSSVSLDTLDNLEILYCDQNNPNLLLSVRYQGEAIRKKIRELYAQYQTETEKVSVISTKYGLDTTQEQVSLHEFEQYIREIGATEADAIERSPAVFDLPIRRSAQLSFIMHPDTARYGDSIECFGYYFSLYGYRDQGVPGKQVTVYIDTTPVSTITTDEIGSYAVEIPVERIRAGTHSLHAESGTTQSDVRMLNIVPVDSVTSLTVSTANSKGEVTCTGSVVANRPVRFAPVELVWDGSHASSTTTDAKGEFRAPLRLPDGTHTVIARFSDEGYPIRPSESEPQVVDVSVLRTITPAIIIADYSWLVLLLLVGGIFLAFAGGAWYYLKRMPGRTFFGSPAAPPPDMTIPAGSHQIAGTDEFPPLDEVKSEPTGDGTAPESLFTRYAHILQEQGLSAAARTVYLTFSVRIAQELHLQRYTSLTPREVSRSCTKKSYCGPFSSFILVYEQVRYGGYRSAAVQAEFETEMKNTASHLGGEDH